MFTRRLKFGSEENKEWRCFLCLHVRTATILFGILHLALQVLTLSVLALIVHNYNIIEKNEEIQNDFLPTPLSKKDDDNPYFLPTTQDGSNIYSSDIDMGALMTMCTLCITLLMVYGTFKGKPLHLLPFFFLQLFDFAITTLTATGYFCYLRSAHHFVAEQWNLPFRHELLQLSPHSLTLLVLAAFVLSLLWKAYWISVMWRCYRYLTLRQQSARNTIHYIVPDADRANDPDFSLFGGHGLVFGAPLKQTPPPSYQDVMGEQPPPYPSPVLPGAAGQAESAEREEFLTPATPTSTTSPSTSDSVNVEIVVDDEVVQTEPAQSPNEMSESDDIDDNHVTEAVNPNVNVVIKETTDA